MKKADVANGRRNGLKIRWAVNGPCRFESGHRHSENVIFIGKFSRCGLNDGCEQSRMETALSSWRELMLPSYRRTYSAIFSRIGRWRKPLMPPRKPSSRLPAASAAYQGLGGRVGLGRGVGRALGEGVGLG